MKLATLSMVHCCLCYAYNLLYEQHNRIDSPLMHTRTHTLNRIGTREKKKRLLYTISRTHTHTYARIHAYTTRKEKK